MSADKILVVDDDKSLLDLIQMRLEDSGFEVTPANNENEARRVAAIQTFDAAVIDLQLANQDGLSLMEELHLVQPDMPAIILTAHGSIESAVEAMTKVDTISDTLIFQENDIPDASMTMSEAKADFEKNYLHNLLKATAGNVSKAAEVAGKYRADLYALLKKHGISPGNFKK